MSSQLEDLKKHLKAGRFITSAMAFSLYGCCCLHRRIIDLEGQGLKIKRTWKEGKNRHGRMTRYLRYSI